MHGTGQELSGKQNGQGGLIYRIALGAVLILGITFLYPLEKIYLPLDTPAISTIASEDIVAPFDFPVYKSDEELERDRFVVIANLKPVVRFDSSVYRGAAVNLAEFFAVIDSVSELPGGAAPKIAAIKQRITTIPDSVVNMMLNPRTARAIEKASTIIAERVFAEGIMADPSRLPMPGSGLVVIKNGDESRTVIREKILDTISAKGYCFAIADSLSSSRDRLIWKTAATIVAKRIVPNLEFDTAATEQLRKAELDAIPRTKGMVFKGEKIIGAGEKISEVQYGKLVSLSKFRRQQGIRGGLLEYILPPLGRLFFVAFPILFFAIYLFYFRKEIYYSYGNLLLFAIIIGGSVLILELVISQAVLSKYLAPLTIAAILATILFDEQVGLTLNISLAMLVGVLAGFNFDLVLVTVVCGTIACFLVRKVRHRHDFYRPILYLCLSYAGSVYLIESLSLTQPPLLLNHVLFGVLNGFLTPILTIGLLPLFETGFGITTDITLLELSDLNRPLLKRLAIDAPGTYHHSIMIGTLAEDAAESIGANSLLARVGSYYHDIGKMLKPEYFVENQMEAENKHEKLAPTMSALILEAHVKEGVELARRHGLPEKIIEFITGHHGTGMMTYFYEKARKEFGDGVDPRDFRYPGPNPRSKEVAIVMLADAVEAASRTLDDPKPARIRGLVHRLFMERLDSGLLENSNLTLREIKKIEDSFVRVLTAFFHRRIKYPEKKEELS